MASNKNQSQTWNQNQKASNWKQRRNNCDLFHYDLMHEKLGLRERCAEKEVREKRWTPLQCAFYLLALVALLFAGAACYTAVLYAIEYEELQSEDDCCLVDEDNYQAAHGRRGRRGRRFRFPKAFSKLFGLKWMYIHGARNEDNSSQLSEPTPADASAPESPSSSPSADAGTGAIVAEEAVSEGEAVAETEQEESLGA